MPLGPRVSASSLPSCSSWARSGPSFPPPMASPTWRP
uniref:Uncharacterized protein n=1 Tax=Siphoviridae sp. ctz7e2 TaxID=2826526 RepID=A0A8S5M3N3_9CAUD|nr:MAG TPA: hypothetical protein [Siphoviridae sp. ctz7e2]DAQ92444.1 MAG TPA: hypothetical protein [Caudoviricetes sp.]